MWFLCAATLLAVLLVLAPRPRLPHVLYNRTPSVPTGFYWRVGRSPSSGDLVAFPLPEAAKDYARRRGEHTDIVLLKPVLATTGDRVSTLNDELRINGVLIGRIPGVDSAGRTLPRWHGDRVLAADELLVGSLHIGSSFDSRFFGPIHASQVLGVYQPLTFAASTSAD